MRPNINVLEEVDGVLQAVTREMTPEEYEAHLAQHSQEGL